MLAKLIKSGTPISRSTASRRRRASNGKATDRRFLYGNNRRWYRQVAVVASLNQWNAMQCKRPDGELYGNGPWLSLSMVPVSVH